MITATTVTHIRRHLYVYGSIKPVEHYSELMQEIDTEWNIPMEDIILHINSPGGSVSTLLSLVGRLKDARKLYAVAEGECCSAALFLFLLADYRASMNDSLFMAHNVMISSDINNVSNVSTYSEKASALADSLVETYMKPFLNKRERESIKHGKELYFDVKEALVNKMINCDLESIPKR